MRRYRYISCGLTDIDDPICYFRLISGREIKQLLELVRVSIPDDMVLIKYPGELYSTTDDTRQIKNLNPVPVINIKKGLDKKPVWVKRPELLKYPICDWYNILRIDYGLQGTSAGYYIPRQLFEEDLRRSRKWDCV